MGPRHEGGRAAASIPQLGAGVATIGELLNSGVVRLRASGSESARLDAELLLGWAIGAGRTAVLAHPEAPVGADAAAAYEAAVVRRQAGEPVAYIRGLKEFHGVAIAVDRRALIPRPETELMVDEAERDVAWRLTSAPRPAGTPKIRIVDVGTGSGAAAIALALRLGERGMLSEVTLVAADCSPDALDLARENAVGHAVANAISFVTADLLPAGRPFDVILANLPYIPSAEVDRLPIAASFEPRIALDGGPDGLSLVGRLISLLPGGLAEDGSAYLEIGFDQAPAVEALVRALPGTWSCAIKKDLSGRDRLVEIIRSIPPLSKGR
jgi:release factor glutamine methyltransferase